MLCTEVLNGLVRALRAVDLAPEEDYRLVAISIDPRETPELAREKEARYLLLYDADDDTAESGWRFLVGTQDAVDRATDAAGFRYVYDERSDQYAHASGVLVASGGGVLTHYFYGIEYAPRDLRLALVEASEGRIGTLVDAFLMMCFHYDPATGRYGFAIQSALRVAGIATVVVLAGAIARMRARERRAASSAARPPAHAEGVRP
jgi:protein SCO1/2